MHSDLFSVSGYTVHAYSFFIYLAALISVGGSFWLARKRGIPAKYALLILFTMLAGAFIGARLLHIALNFNLYKSSPGLALSFDFHGFSLYGGVLTAAFLALILGRKLKIDFWKMGDASAPFLGAGIILLRIGCFLNGCCFGKVTNSFWGVRFPALSQAHIHQLSHGEGNMFSVAPVHPAQLFEVFGALIASGAATIILKKKYPDGSAALAFVIIFTAFRWINYSFFRVIPDTFQASPYFYPILYGGIILSSLILLQKKVRPDSQ